MPRGKQPRRFHQLQQAMGRRLRALRIVAGYETADAFAALLGIEPARYRKYERGEATPAIDVLESIGIKTETSIDWLLFGWRPGADRVMPDSPDAEE